MISKKMKRLIVVCFLSLCFLPGALSPKHVQAGKDPYPDFIDYIVPEVDNILIKYGMPVKHDRDCPWIKWSGKPGSYTIYFYLSDEIPQKAVLDTIRLFMDLNEKRERKEKFAILMYRESHAEEIKPFSDVEPFLEFRMKGEK